MTALDLAALIAFLWFATIALWVWLEHRRQTGISVKRALAKAERQAGK